MDEFEEINHQLIPHKYPPWVLSFGVIVLLASIYSLVLVPKYITASVKLRAGQRAYYSKNYPEAIQLYQQVLKAVPSSKEAKISIAEAYFANPNSENRELGLIYLEGIRLGRSDTRRLEQVMPSEYKQYFQKVR